MIVADASAAVNALIHDGDARRALEGEAVAVPHLADAEVTATLRAQATRRELPLEDARMALLTWMVYGVERMTTIGLLDRIWDLRENITPYDATYVALAESLGCDLLTADARLAAVPGPRCRMTVVRG